MPRSRRWLPAAHRRGCRHGRQCEPAERCRGCLPGGRRGSPRRTGAGARRLVRRLGGGRLRSVADGERKSVVWGKSVSVRVDIGGSRIIKNRTTTTNEVTK